jgi:hypothetical protein
LILKNYFFKPEVAFEFATSLETFLKIVQLPLEVSKVNAAHEVLDSHNVWQDSTFLNFLEVLTVAIFPLNVIFSFGSKFMSAAKDGKATTIKLKANNLVNVFI